MQFPALDSLPPLPQRDGLRRLVTILWRQEDVTAIWLGGSFATGGADEFSDMDLRVAVRPESLDVWRHPDLGVRLFGNDVIGSGSFPLGPEVLLHYLALSSGDLVDLLVQDTEQTPFGEAILVLASRDDGFTRRLADMRPPPAPLAAPADPTIIREAIVGFWINTLKHRKVLHRHALEILGMPLTNRGEIVQAIEANRQEVSRVGRQLAATLGFEYLVALEQTASQTWGQYRDSGSEAGHQRL